MIEYDHDVAAAQEARDAADRREYWGEWRWWIAGVVVLTAAWGLRGLWKDDLDRFWPVVPLGIWAAVLLVVPLLPRQHHTEK